MMDSNVTERGAKPRISNINRNQTNQLVRKNPPRIENDRNNIYITTKTNFKAQLKRCEDLLNSGAREIYLHCMGYSITRGLNLALHLIGNSEGALNYAINTSTIQLVDELHPLCDEDDITFRQRNNSALHIKIFNSSAFDIIVPDLSTHPAQSATVTKPLQRKQKQQPQKHTKKQS